MEVKQEFKIKFNMSVSKLELNNTQVNWIKGLLMVFVVADHNDLFRIWFDQLFRPFTFHVIGFFVIAYISSIHSKKNIARFSAERIVRYGWPYICFYVLYGLGSFILSKGANDLWTLVLGALIGSYEMVKAGCGGAFMWFLPALLGFTIISCSFSRWRFSSQAVFFTLMLMFYFLASEVSVFLKIYTPLGVVVVAYIFAEVVLVKNIFFNFKWSGYFETYVGIAITSAVGVISYWYVVRSGYMIEVGAVITPPSNRIDVVIASGLNNIASLLAILGMARRFSGMSIIGKMLQKIGENSLQIYLLHPLILAFCIKITGLIVHRPVGVSAFLLGIVVELIVLNISCLLSIRIFGNATIKSILFPSDIGQLRSAFVGLLIRSAKNRQ